ncbi:hypothetical protein C819_00457 [Lachnospiraceae bacterium 10-1]|nr:hypothetical protein C819_00457 [Lachnospiraceae bacterium 10-1]
MNEMMEISEVINYILYIILTAVLPVVAAYAVSLIKAKIIESGLIADAAKNEVIGQIIESALSDVMDAVLYVNQVYTDSLKASGRFDEAAQKEAFNRAYVEAINLISDQAKKTIEQLYGSFDKWLKLKIEAAVSSVKKTN